MRNRLPPAIKLGVNLYIYRRLLVLCESNPGMIVITESTVKKNEMKYSLRMHIGS